MTSTGQPGMNCYEDSKTQSENVCYYFSSCLCVFVAKMLSIKCNEMAF